MAAHKRGRLNKEMNDRIFSQPSTTKGPKGSEHPFIHANVMPMRSVEWIMAQAPFDGSEGKAGTKEVHWVMIEQKKVGLTIQLCDPDEECCKYYPETVGEKMTIGMYTLTALEKVYVTNWFSEGKELYSMMKIEYKRKNIKRTVDMLRFYGWPEDACPATSTPALEMIEFADQYKRPIIVHCSSGVGRVGALVGIKKGMEMCQKGPPPGLHRILREIMSTEDRALETREQILYLMYAVTDGLAKKYGLSKFCESVPALRFAHQTMLKNDAIDAEWFESEGAVGFVAEKNKFVEEARKKWEEKREKEMMKQLGQKKKGGKK